MPTYCKVKRTLLAQQLDGWDADTMPDSSPLHGNVTFTPQLADGDAVTLYDDGKPVTIVPAPIKALISDGQIFHRGVDYIELLAGGDRMNPATLVWKATFTNLQAKGTLVKLRPVVFEAVPDGTVDLTIVAPAPGTAGQGVVKGRDGDHIEGLAVEGTNLVLRVKDGDGVTRSEQIAIGEVAKTVANDAVTRAEADAEAAKGSAEAAAGSASTASARAGEADASAKAAKVSEDRAKGSEVNAKASEDSAAAHAESAGEKAQQVQQGMTEVAGLAWALDEGVKKADVSATAAKSSEDAARASESAAKQSETSAQSSATAAADARDSAQAFAGTAQTQAHAAQTQGDRAKTEADRAAASAAEAAETASSGIPDATASMKGKVLLAGDLSGTADAPTVPKLAAKADLVGGQVPTSQLPAVALVKPNSVTDRAGMLALTAQEGDVAVITAGADKGTYMLGQGAPTAFASWVKLVSPDAPVQSVNGQTGTVNLSAANVGAAPTSHTHTIANVAGLQAALDGKATSATVNSRPALFSGAGAPPAAITGAVVGDWWLNTTNMELSKITGV